MTLAGMLALDEEAFICDMAETYHIYDYKRVPCRTLGILAAGLRDDSRIRQKQDGISYNTEQILLARIYDAVNLNLWMQTEAGAKGRNRPKSLYEAMTRDAEQTGVHRMTYEEWKEIHAKRAMKGKDNGNRSR